MTRCTWQNCTNPFKCVYKSQSGEVWARLCAEHDEIIKVAIKDAEPKRLLSCYIKAQGGSKVAAQRTMQSL